MVTRALWFIVVLAGIAQIAVNVEEIQRGRYGVTATYVGLYLALIFFAANKRIPFTLRALAAPVILYLVGVSELWLYTIVSNAVLYFFTTVILTGILIGFRAGFAALLLCIATLAGFAWIYVAGHLPTEPQPQHLLLTRPEMASQLVNWLNIGIPFVFVSGSLLICVTVMMKALLAQTNESAKLVAELRAENVEREHTNEALERSERRLREAQHIARVGSFEWNLLDGSLTWSETLCEIFGFSIAATPTWSMVRDRIVEADRPKFNEAFVQVRKSGVFEWTEFQYYGPDEAVRTIVLRMRALPDESGNRMRVTGTIQDVTERVTLEAHERELEEQLRQAQKMEAVGQLAGGIAHDFNNILQSILGHSQLLLESDLENRTAIETSLREIEIGGRRAASLVDQLLTFSRTDRTTRRQIDLGQTVHQAIQFMRSTLPATIELDIDIDENCAPIMADATQIHQIIVNLSTNASDAMQPGGGQIHVSIQSQHIAREIVASTGVVIPGDYIVMNFSDTGTGIPTENLAHIFTPFFTTKDIGKGTGLGLSVVHGIAQSMGAAIDVTSGPNRGTEFRFYFQPSTGADVVPVVLESDDESPQTGTGHVLFIDDEESIATLYKKALERRGFEVTAFTNPLEALDHFSGHTDLFSIVVTDLTMPKLTGVELASSIHSHHPTIPVILTSGRFEQDFQSNPDISATLSKPAPVDELVELINQSLLNP